MNKPVYTGKIGRQLVAHIKKQQERVDKIDLQIGRLMSKRVELEEKLGELLRRQHAREELPLGYNQVTRRGDDR